MTAFSLVVFLLTGETVTFPGYDRLDQCMADAGLLKNESGVDRTVCVREERRAR